MNEITEQSQVSISANSSGDQSRKPSPIVDLFKNANFRLLWFGESISLLGDQFYMIALPWLVLQLTGDAFAMGTVLAMASIPRALFMLLGGALTDRFSPRRIMLASNLLRLILVALLSAMVLTGSIQLWMLYLFSFIFGVVDAFFFPASNAIVPQIVEKDKLQSGNAVVQGTAQLSIFAGPVLAGFLISLLSDGPAQAPVTSTPDLVGIGVVFGLDALTFVMSALTLWLIKLPGETAVAAKAQQEKVLTAIRHGMRVVWTDLTLRTFFFIIAAINLLFNGPILVGIPVLANSRLPEGAIAFGIIMSAFGGGALAGTLLAGILPKPKPQLLGSTLLGIISILGIGLGLLGLAESTAIAAAITGAMGMANGYVNILFITWLQQRTPQAMLGRMMSLIMFASIGVTPISMALAGALIAWNLTVVFVVAGAILALITWLSALNPTVRTMSSTLATESLNVES